MSPYAIWTGPYGYVAKGAALRDLGYGEIDLTWPGPGTTQLVAAYLIWSLLNNSTPPSTGMINGHAIVGTWTAYTSPSPCWEPTYIYTYAADVTDFVVNGENSLTEFPSHITNGSSPWYDGSLYEETGILADGASLIAIYDSGSSTTQQITVYTGAETTEGAPITETLQYGATDSKYANTTFIVADGQLPGNSAYWNGSLVQANAFPGDDPKDTTTVWSEGNLSDTKSYAVQVPKGSTSVQAEITSGEGGDCLTWTGQVVSVQIAPAPGPYAVTFEEQGLNPGITWTVTINSNGQSGLSTASGSSVAFTLPNGSYTYQVTPIPGYSGPTQGSFVVDGGPLFLRLAFHVTLYAITFTETGLPSDYYWYAGVYNASDDVIANDTLEAPASITYSEPNGSYHYYAGEYGLYTTKSPKGPIDVDGPGPYLITIPFVAPPLFAVTFDEHGLLPATKWGGEIYSNFGDFSDSVTTTSFVLELPNTSKYSEDSIVPSVPTGFTPQMTSIGFFVKGAPVTVAVNYSELFGITFTESGLPAGTYWYLNLSGPVSVSRGSELTSFVASIPNGSYTFDVDEVYGYLANPESSGFTVAGANFTVPIVFTPAPRFPIYFNETGLPSGHSWSVQLYLPNGSEPKFSSTGPSIKALEPNRTYTYEVLSVTGFTATPDYGQVTLHGSPVTVNIVFRRDYKVVFEESGLPTGSYWYVYLNGTYNGSTGRFLSYEVTNGSYPFDVYDDAGFTAVPASGSLTVASAGVLQPVAFSLAGYPTYPVTVTETGLPVGTNWTAALDYYDNTSTGSSMTFFEENGTFPLYVYGTAGFTATPDSVEVTVDGGPASQAVVYAAPSYGLTFFESGLPADTLWSVTIGSTTLLSTNGTVYFLEAPGTYDYTPAASGYQAAPDYGEVTITDYSELVRIAFSLPTYEVTFTETGLTAGTQWWVNLTGGTSFAPVTTSTTEDLASGSYDYKVATTEKTEAAAPGTFSVDASPTTVSITFLPVLYEITFTETGLPGGATWWVNLTGQTPVKVVGATSTSVELINGSYSYTAAALPKSYTASGGTVPLHGAAQSVTIAFHSSGGSPPPSSPSSSASGLFGLPGDEGYGLLGGIVAAFLLIFVLLLTRRKKREERKGPEGTPPPGANPPPPPPPGGPAPPPSG